MRTPLIFWRSLVDFHDYDDDDHYDDDSLPCVATSDPPNLLESIPRKMTPPHGYLSTTHR